MMQRFLVLLVAAALCAVASGAVPHNAGLALTPPPGPSHAHAPPPDSSAKSVPGAQHGAGIDAAVQIALAVKVSKFQHALNEIVGSEGKLVENLKKFYDQFVVPVNTSQFQTTIHNFPRNFDCAFGMLPKAIHLHEKLHAEMLAKTDHHYEEVVVHAIPEIEAIDGGASGAFIAMLACAEELQHSKIVHEAMAKAEIALHGLKEKKRAVKDKIRKMKEAALFRLSKRRYDEYMNRVKPKDRPLVASISSYMIQFVQRWSRYDILLGAAVINAPAILLLVILIA
jgi:hypothetical protein